MTTYIHQGLGELEYYTLRNISAFETLREHFNTRASTRVDPETLPDRVTAGTVEQAGPPTPMYTKLRGRLSAAGIHADFDDSKLTFHFARPVGIHSSLPSQFPIRGYMPKLLMKLVFVKTFPSIVHLPMSMLEQSGCLQMMHQKA